LVRDMEGILEIVMAFSREGGDGNRYVQHKVKERGDEVCKMLSEGANLYICGRATMARDVGRVVEELMQERNRWSEVDVHNWSRLAKKDNKWQQDVWA
jgi:NADPH-ferrihemoprotein reductase